MSVCRYCGNEFNLTSAKQRIGREYGAGIYDDYFPNGDVCGSCAIEEIGPDFGSGGEDIENMGSGWDWD